jgi:uridine kinase
MMIFIENLLAQWLFHSSIDLKQFPILDVVLLLSVWLLLYKKGIYNYHSTKIKNIIFFIFFIISVGLQTTAFTRVPNLIVSTPNHYDDIVKLFLAPLFIYAIFKQRVITYGMVVAISLIWFILCLALQPYNYTLLPLVFILGSYYWENTTKTGRYIALVCICSYMFTVISTTATWTFFEIKPLYLASISFTYSFFLILCLRCFNELFYHDKMRVVLDRPVSIGISGDSGVGKTTVTNSLIDVLGLKDCATIRGDGYHKWPRRSPFWLSNTHLNPNSNNLRKMNNDIVGLLSGENISSRSYNHSTGTFTQNKLLHSNRFVIVEGLFSLFDQRVVNFLDVGVYISVEPELRMEWKLARDSSIRQQNKKKIMDREAFREKDKLKYILPQEKNADIIFNIYSASGADALTDCLDLKQNSQTVAIEVSLTQIVDIQRLTEFLTCICDLEIFPLDDADHRYRFRISGVLIIEKLQLGFRDLMEMNALYKNTQSLPKGLHGIIVFLICLIVDKKVARRRRKFLEY